MENYKTNLAGRQPILFYAPTKKHKNVGSLFSIFTALFVGFLSVFDSLISLPFFHIACLVLACHGLVAFITTKPNLLYLMRYFFVWSLFFITSLVYAIFDGKILMS